MSCACACRKTRLERKGSVASALFSKRSSSLPAKSLESVQPLHHCANRPPAGLSKLTSLAAPEQRSSYVCCMHPTRAEAGVGETYYSMAAA